MLINGPERCKKVEWFADEILHFPMPCNSGKPRSDPRSGPSFGFSALVGSSEGVVEETFKSCVFTRKSRIGGAFAMIVLEMTID